VLLVAGAIGGWLLFRPGADEEEPIVVGTTSTPSMVDPAGAYEAAAWNLMSNVFQSLLTYEPGQDQPVPDAAERCEFTDHQLTVYRCTLRDDLRFSNGNPVTPEDVKFSFDRILAMAERAEREAADDSIPEDEKFTYAGPASLLATLAAVRVDGQDVIFELTQSDATFPHIVAGSVGAIVDRESYEELEPRDDGVVVGSGPYLLEEYRQDEYAELVPNPDYRGAFEVPETPVTVRYFVQGEDGTSADELLARAWEAGELDVNDGKMPPGALADVNRGDPRYSINESTGSAVRVMAFNTDEGMALGDRVARQAVAGLLDREEISTDVQQGTVEPAYSLIPVGFTGHGTPFYDRYRDADPAELGAAMEAAGLTLPVEFTLAYSRGAATTAEAELIERQLESDGLFDVTIEYHEWTDFFSTIYGSRDYDAYLITWQPDYPDPATFTDGILGPGDGLATGFGDDEINRLITRTQAEPDRGKAAEDFRAIHELAAEAAPIIPIWQEKVVTLSTSDITGIQYLNTNSGMWPLWQLRRI
jgi:peptide/nickel transport system substrate-binding protein